MFAECLPGWSCYLETSWANRKRKPVGDRAYILNCIFMAGVNFAPAKPIFQQLIPDEHFLYQEVFNASEGYYATQFRSGEEGILLLNNAIFYEFKDTGTDHGPDRRYRMQ